MSIKLPYAITCVNMHHIFKVKLYLAMLLIAALVVHKREAQTTITFIDEHPDHPGKCYVSSENKAYDVGSAWPVVGSCEQNTCHWFQEGMFLINTTGCRFLFPPSNCELVSDITAPYPECCPRIQCPNRD